jgi:hypothetical protein
MMYKCGTRFSLDINNPTSPGFIDLMHTLLNHVLGVLALLPATRTRRLRTRSFVKGTPIRLLSNKRTLVRCEEFVVYRVGLFISVEVLRWKTSTNVTPHMVKTRKRDLPSNRTRHPRTTTTEHVSKAQSVHEYVAR